MQSFRLMILIASTRPGRIGPAIGEWVTEVAEQHGGFDVDVVDLADLDLPLVDEPNHPRLRQYTKDHTKRWSERVDAADAFLFVMPEYNHGYTAPLKNALDYVFEEWAYKPVGLVSYGGVSGGTRATQLLKPVLAGLKLVAITEAVAIPFVRQHIDEDERFHANDDLNGAAKAMLDEVARWAGALAPLRSPAA